MRVFDSEGGSLCAETPVLGAPVHALALHPEGHLLAGLWDGRILRLALPDLSPLGCLRGPGSWICAIEPLGDGALLIATEHRAELLDPAGALIRSFDGHAHWVRDLASSPSRRLLATASRDGTVGIWQLDRGTRLHSLEGHTQTVAALALEPEAEGHAGRRLASASWDGTVRIHDLPTGRTLQVLPCPEGRSQRLAWCPQTGQLYAGSGSWLRRFAAPGGSERGLL